jgi:hypothetical protein
MLALLLRNHAMSHALCGCAPHVARPHRLMDSSCVLRLVMPSVEAARYWDSQAAGICRIQVEEDSGML